MPADTSRVDRYTCEGHDRDFAGLIGPTPWGEVDVTLLRSGMYAKVLDEAAIPFPPIDWDAVVRTEAVIAGGVNR